jgi:hypothetical protein
MGVLLKALKQLWKGEYKYIGCYGCGKRFSRNEIDNHDCDKFYLRR